MVHTLLVFGGNGVVGREVGKFFEKKMWKVVSLSREECDITDLIKVKKNITEYQPNAIVNATGMIGIEKCENNPYTAWSINAFGAGNIPQALTELLHPIPFVSISTSYVFSGGTKAHTEDEQPVPVTTYGWSKYAGEKLIEAVATPTTIPYYVIRSSWLYGGVRSSLVDEAISALKKGLSIQVADDQYGIPVSVSAMASMIFTLVTETPLAGVYHLSENVSERLSKYDFVHTATELLSLDISLLKRISSIDLGGRFHAHNGMLAVSKQVTPFSWKEELKYYLHTKYGGI